MCATVTDYEHSNIVSIEENALPIIKCFTYTPLHGGLY